jgi:prepilin-type N-terminal cleavage/methylation domain-containing protein
MIGAESLKTFTAALRSRLRRRRLPTKAAGFTLVELLVVLGIFSIVVVSASDIFLLVSRAQRKVFALERTQADARFSMEAIARELRTGRIDYDAYGAGLESPTDTLRIVDADGTTLVFRRSAVDETSLCADAASAPCLLVAVNGGTPAPMTPKGAIARNLQFYVSPTEDPTTFTQATGSYSSDIQPHVTVVLGIESVGVQAAERALINIQTTVVTRDYRR